MCDEGSVYYSISKMKVLYCTSQFGSPSFFDHNDHFTAEHIYPLPLPLLPATFYCAWNIFFGGYVNWTLH